MQVTGVKEPFLDFVRELCEAMMSEHGSPPVRRNTHVVDPADEARYDDMNHWMAGTELDAARKEQAAQLPLLRPAEEAGHEDGVPLREVQGAAAHPLLQGKDFLLLNKNFW
jgi:hypothetical protein